jgi:hypothetical protein
MKPAMKLQMVIPLAAMICAGVVVAQEGSEAKQLQVYPKNLARQHIGANLFIFNSSTGTYVPTEASAAWLDDDVTTGWPIMAGKQHYLLALPEPELLTNLSISARPATGTVNIFAGDEPATPSAKSWSAVARDIPIDSINEKKLPKSFNKLAKYVLIETDVTDAGPMYSLNVYGSRSAVSYQLRQREQAIDTQAIFGKYVNNPTTFNVDGLYAGSTVEYANSPDGFIAWQQLVDDNPESAVRILPSTNEAGAVVRYEKSQTISRVGLLGNASAKGKLDFYVLGPDALTDTGKPVSVSEMTPAVSIVLDGSSPRSSIDFPPMQAAGLAVRWSPVDPNEVLTVRELNAFGSMTLADHEVSSPLTIADASNGYGDGAYDPSKDGTDPKEMLDPKDPKVPIAIGGSPYLPGALGFPPNITGRLAPLLPPDPLSP